MKEKKNVALLYGGRSAEHDVSVSGAKFVYPLISREHFNPLPIYIKRSGEMLLLAPDESVADGVPAELCRGGIRLSDERIPVHAALPLLHGEHGEDGSLQGALLHSDIPFVGCGVHAGALTSDKAFTKLVAEGLGIPTVEWILSVNGGENMGRERSRRRAELTLGYPMFIKPARQGSSIGAHAVSSPDDFDEAYSDAASHGDGRVIIERLASVKSEIECAYFAPKGKVLFTKIGEIPSSGRFYDYDGKYSSTDFSPRADSPLDTEFGDAVRAYSRALCEYIGIRHLARIDFFLTEDGRLLFNEINTMPGFTSGSLYPAMLAVDGISAESAIDLLIRDVLEE